jgi:signal transduction histidine kinase
MSQLKDFVTQVPALFPDQLVSEVADVLLGNKDVQFLSMPVLDDGCPVGSISRYELQSIFMRRYGRELLGGKPISDLMNKKPIVIDADDSLENVSRHIIGQGSSVVMEDFIVTEGGRYIGMGSMVAILQAMEGRLSSRNKQLLKAYGHLKSSQSQLIQAEKMSSLGQMVAGVAHEINTPLGYVRGNVAIANRGFEQQSEMLNGYAQLITMVGDEESDPDEVNALLGELTRQRQDFMEAYSDDEVTGLFDDTLHGVSHMAEIVRGLRDFSRLDQVPVENVDINSCLDSSLLIAHNQIKNKVVVVKEYGDLPKVTCRPSQINQVLLNLITNAAQAIPTDARSEGRIVATTFADKTFVHVSIEDNGCGIPQDKLKKIFEPFFTTKPVGQGTGLGLSVAYNIIREHKGRFNVFSTLGVGTKFTVSLPLVTA